MAAARAMIRCRALAERRLSPVDILWIPLAGVALGQRFVLPGVSIADLCLGAFVVLALREQRGEPWHRPPWAPWLLGFVAWVFVAGFVTARDPFFSATEFARSAVKLVFYAGAALVLARTVKTVGLRADRAHGGPRLRDLRGARDRGVPGAARARTAALRAHLRAPRVPQRVLLRAALVRRRQRARADRERLPPCAGPRRRAGAARPAARPRARASCCSRGGCARHPAVCALVAVAAVLTFSLAGYALLLPVLGLFGLRLLRASALPAAVGRGDPGGAPRGGAPLPPVARTLKRSIVVRSQRILEGRADSSARLRVFGSWDMALLLAREHPVVGRRPRGTSTCA